MLLDLILISLQTPFTITLRLWMSNKRMSATNADMKPMPVTLPTPMADARLSDLVQPGIEIAMILVLKL